MTSVAAVDLPALKRFLARANLPHATGTASTVKEADGSRTIVFTEGDWTMHDNFFGGEPYGGRQVIFYRGRPVWMTVYYGRVTAKTFSPDELYGFLREALQHPPQDKPYRGPASYKKGSLEYRNRVSGEADDYSGKEVILKEGKQIYWARYIGGLVDQRAQSSM